MAGWTAPPCRRLKGRYALPNRKASASGNRSAQAPSEWVAPSLTTTFSRFGPRPRAAQEGLQHPHVFDRLPVEVRT